MFKDKKSKREYKQSILTKSMTSNGIITQNMNLTDAGQPEQNWNNGKIKGYDLGVST